MDTEKIISALKHCIEDKCDGCPYQNTTNSCLKNLHADILKCIEKYFGKLKVDIYIYKQTEVDGKIAYETTSTYLGFAEVDKFDPDEIFHLCNWSCWTQEKPNNLYADIDCCGHGLCLVNPITQERYLAKSVGWLVGDSVDIDKYVMTNRYRLTYWK